MGLVSLCGAASCGPGTVYNAARDQCVAAAAAGFVDDAWWLIRATLWSASLVCAMAFLARCAYVSHAAAAADDLANRRQCDPVWERAIEAKLARVQYVAHLADHSLLIGLDPLISLVPVVGDLLAAYPTWSQLQLAHDMGVPSTTMLQLVGNAATDVAIGSIPAVGDVLDIFWRSNTRNAALLHNFWEGRGSSHQD
jgi:hypothetical protein